MASLELEDVFRALGWSGSPGPEPFARRERSPARAVPGRTEGPRAPLPPKLGGEEASAIFGEVSGSSSASSHKFFFSLFLLAKVQLLAKMTEKEFPVILPSDQAWRLKNYFKLLNKQKEKTLILHTMPLDNVDEAPRWEQVVVSQSELKRTKVSGSTSTEDSEGSVVTSRGPSTYWNSLDLAKAASLLGPDSADVTFSDEDEMRKIFALLHDVFRYKNILNEALQETGFFQKYPQHERNISLVWLLFFDLHKRRFLPRIHEESLMCAEVFEKVGLTNIEEDLWALRIKLAASLARSRIKKSALRLNQLLPHHLRDERFISVNETPVTGWINTFQKNKKEICDSIEKLGLKLQSEHETVLTENDFRFDHLCPKLLLCHPVQRPELAQSSLIKNHTIILQDRAFCLGPAIMCKILTETPLRGTVAQTHINTPRTTAYLATVLADNDRLEKLVAFGAGDRLLEYQSYLHDLGVNNCEVYAQRFAEIHPEAAVLENLVAVFATPPNSYTAVADPVDLICSRGGDLNILKDLTQLELGENSKKYLSEQKDTLKYCMSLPQVQIILYETHSTSPEENSEMVNNVIEMMNTLAKEKHEEEHRLSQEKEEEEARLNKPVFIPGQSSSREQKQREAQEAKNAAVPKKFEVPPCDLFEVASLPELCSHGSICFSEEGCYLAKIQRKEIISLDAKYMIKIAEARGLFGTEPAKKKVVAARAPKKQERRRVSSAKIKVKRAKLEIERITAPTQSTISRKKETSPLYIPSPPCPRHQSHTSDIMNKDGAEELMTTLAEDKGNSRSRKSQEECDRRLSAPRRRGSSSPENFSSEVKPRFWKYATAKSIEDLILTLRKKRKGKRIFKVEDHFFFKEPYLSQQQRRAFMSESGKYDITEATNSSASPRPTTSELKSLDASTKPKKSTTGNPDSFVTDVEVIKPYINKDVLRIISYGTVSDQSSTRTTPSSKSLIAFDDRNRCNLIQQCMDNASVIFKKIDEAIEENRKLTEKILTSQGNKSKDPFNQKTKFKNKSFSPLEALSKIEEISNIVDFKKSHTADIILSSKYLSTEEVTQQQQEFVKTLQKKLEKLHQSYQHWTKWQEENSVEKFFVPRKFSKKVA